MIIKPPWWVFLKEGIFVIKLSSHNCIIHNLFSSVKNKMISPIIYEEVKSFPLCFNPLDMIQMPYTSRIANTLNTCCCHVVIVQKYLNQPVILYLEIFVFSIICIPSGNILDTFPHLLLQYIYDVFIFHIP